MIAATLGSSLATELTLGELGIIAGVCWLVWAVMALRQGRRDNR